MCNHSPTVYGNILTQELEDILKNETLIKFKNKLIFPDECKLLKDCRSGCRAVAETMYGDIYKPDPIFQKNLNKNNSPQDLKN